MSLHVHILSVCHFMCTYYRYATSHVHTIGMHLHVHILWVCHFMCTYRYVTPHKHIIGMSLHVHILLLCRFTCIYYRYVTSFARTMNAVFKMCSPFISQQVRGLILPVVTSEGYMHLGKVCKQFT
jgi:hypothetical protein